MLSEGGLKDGEERDQPMEEDSADAELLSGYQWLLQDLPKLPLFDSVRGMTSTALQQVSVRQEMNLLGDLMSRSLNCAFVCSPEGYSHGNRSANDQRLSHILIPACTGGGTGFSQ